MNQEMYTERTMIPATKITEKKINPIRCIVRTTKEARNAISNYAFSQKWYGTFPDIK